MIIVCFDILRFECEFCLLVEENKLECIDNNIFSYMLIIMNNMVLVVIFNMILLEMQIFGYSFNLDFINVILVSGGSIIQMVNINSVVLLNLGDVFYYKVILLGEDGWCCYLDSLFLVVLECG